jgi:ABC-2 type transport system ATP-binding protein
MTNAIEAHGLVKTYPGGARALDGLGFEVEAGTIFGLLGPNGAG